MDFQLSYFPISICIVFSKNWFVTFGTWTQSSFLFFFVCFEKPVIFFCLSSLTFTGRKRIYQQGRKQTQSWQYLHNTLPAPPHTLFSTSEICVHFCCTYSTTQFSLSWKYRGSQNTVHQYSFYNFQNRAWSCAPLGWWQGSHRPGGGKTGPVQSSHCSNTRSAMH